MVFEHNSASNLCEWRTTTLAEYTLEAFGPVLLLSMQRHDIARGGSPPPRE
jgi:hypothetical protein